ncbi:MAG: HAMP domain-containing histidine kinase [Desulfobacterales bacterium]|nr:HAMP domain-containing histidine kinase [Desulfobacterales bacterium]
MYQSASSRERMLLRKLADNYYGVCLVRVIEGIVHNLNGPLQILYIRSEQLEQSLEQLRGTLLSACNAQVEQSEALTEVEVLAGRMEERIKSISRSLDDLNAQMRHLTSDLIVDGCCEIGDVKINQVIEDCLLLLNADMFFKHNVKKTVKLNDALPLLKGRKTDFCIIILNLIQNALEAMVDAQDRHLTVETSCQEDKVIIRVQDTGCGIPEPDREHIYEAFFTTKKGTGHEARLDEHAGLGLSLVSLLLEDYNGTIACESVPGKTTFIVQLSLNLPSVKKMAARKKYLSEQT